MPILCFNAARGMMCVGTPKWDGVARGIKMFQCRTRHDVCRDRSSTFGSWEMPSFNAARGMMCVGT